MAVLDAWRRTADVVFDLEKLEALRSPAPRMRTDAPMIYAHIPGIDRPVSRLVMGSMVFSQRDLPTTCAILDYFVSVGGNAIDTAYVYGGGEAERAVGEWMRLRDNRADVVIVGKGAAPGPGGLPRVTPQDIGADLAESLRRLGTSYIDLYLLHRDDPAIPVGELVRCLNEHHQAGRIRAFGGSNWSTERLQAANDYARAHGLIPFAASSPNFSLARMNEPPWAGCLSASIDGKEWYIAHQFPLLAWSSQAQGFFTGRFTPEDRSHQEMVRCWYSPDNFERLERAREVGRRMGVSANSVALAYVLHQPFPTLALIGPHTIEEARTSAEALDVILTPEDLLQLNLE
jgi:aryl-alcohol dehydrogenase-like predicted oxidoreductase